MKIIFDATEIAAFKAFNARINDLVGTYLPFVKKDLKRAPKFRLNKEVAEYLPFENGSTFELKSEWIVKFLNTSANLAEEYVHLAAGVYPLAIRFFSGYKKMNEECNALSKELGCRGVLELRENGEWTRTYPDGTVVIEDRNGNVIG